MLVADIHHVSINVSDLDRALGFYVDVLGLSTLPRPDLAVDGAWLAAGDGREIHLIVADVPGDLGQHFAFLVDDIDASCAELRGRDIDVAGPFPIGTARQAFFHDPDGNRLELNQPG